MLRTALLIVAKTSFYELHYAALQAPCLGSSIISLPSIRVSSSTITPTLTKCLLANKQNKLCTFSLAPVDNTPLNDFQNAYLALWKWTLQAEYCASAACRQLSCRASSVFSYWRISRKRVEDFKAAFSCHQSIPWIIDLRGRFIKQHTWGL